MSAWVVLQGDSFLSGRSEGAAAKKMFSADVAKGVRLRDFEHFGVDLLAFERCSIEKLQRGGVTFGAFNVLVLEGVTLNLTAVQAEDSQEPEPVLNEKPGVFSAVDFVGRFKSIQGLTGKKFSSLRINRLAVNRWVNAKAEPLFIADSAEGGAGGGKVLRLKGCRVFAGGQSWMDVRDARVEVDPNLILVYRLAAGESKRLSLQ